MHPNEQKINPPDDDPGTLRDSIDEDVKVHTNHLAFDGGAHITPEDLVRYEAEQVSRGRVADVDESSQPDPEETQEGFVDYIELLSWCVPTEIILKLPHTYRGGWGNYPIWKRDEIRGLLSAAGWEVQS